MSARSPVYAPWQPEVGMWVRVSREPGCRAHHSQHGADEDGAYGRIEWIDRSWDDPEMWRAAYEQDGEKDGDPEADARANLGHHYYVQDVLDSGRVTYLDGHYCAAELTQVSEREALAGIAAARRELSHLTPGERLYRAVIGAAGR